MATSTPADSSRTTTALDSQPISDNEQASSTPGVLRLRGGPSSRPRVVWRDDVVDNENMGRKSSKSAYQLHRQRFIDLSVHPVCCIYHKARKFGESSSDESSSDDDSDGGPARNRANRPHTNCNGHHNKQGNGDGTAARDSSGAEVHELSSDDEPNAYERAPGWKKAKKQ